MEGDYLAEYRKSVQSIEHVGDVFRFTLSDGKVVEYHAEDEVAT